MAKQLQRQFPTVHCTDCVQSTHWQMQHKRVIQDPQRHFPMIYGIAGLHIWEKTTSYESKILLPALQSMNRLFLQRKTNARPVFKGDNIGTLLMILQNE